MALIPCARAASTLLVLLAPAPLWAAATYYVAPNGKDSAPGTESEPFATVGKAQSAAAAGDTVLIRGGRYAFSGSGTVGVAFSKSGTANALINYFAYPGEIPIFDFSDLTPSNRVTGLDVRCNYIHLRGLEVMGVHQYQSGQDSWGVRIQGNGNILENLNVHDNDAPGIFITSGADNLVLNCDSHHNYDYLESGGSGDGFGCHSSGGGNVLSGCRAYDNSDDGFDFINAAGSCTVEMSFSFRNGFVPDTSQTAGNGAGFKAGGYGSPPSVPSSGAATHTVRQCVAFGNRAQGFYANHHPGRIYFYNNTAFNNPTNYDMLADSGYPSDHVLRNNIALASGTAISRLSGGTDTSNSWTLSVTVTTADFRSVDQTQALAARAADGSLPEVDFMRLAADSDLVDKGTDVGWPYNGSAPDLGAFESGGASPGTGGATGTGGGPSGGVTDTGGRSSGGVGPGSGGGSRGGTTASGGRSTQTGGSPSGGRSTGGAPSGGATSTGGGVSAGGTLTTGGSPPATGGGAGLETAGAPADTGGSGTPATGGSSPGASGTGGFGTSAGGSAPATGGSAPAVGGDTTGSGGRTSATGATDPGINQSSGSDTESGCGCRLGSNATTGMGPSRTVALLGLGLLAVLRRRRARRSRWASSRRTDRSSGELTR
ncbi:MAG: right-handed parallel beta-helix repeat-containing protein [Polyangiaceae bacterium]|nr:right-handed parallel beta-helix repeat-containing protein [Polyangiaceae bacterium]